MEKVGAGVNEESSSHGRRKKEGSSMKDESSLIARGHYSHGTAIIYLIVGTKRKRKNELGIGVVLVSFYFF